MKRRDFLKRILSGAAAASVAVVVGSEESKAAETKIEKVLEKESEIKKKVSKKPCVNEGDPYAPSSHQKYREHQEVPVYSVDEWPPPYMDEKYPQVFKVQFSKTKEGDVGQDKDRDLCIFINRKWVKMKDGNKIPANGWVRLITGDYDLV